MSLLLMFSGGSGATVATGDVRWSKAYVKFRGTVRVILPDAGAYGRRQVEVTAYDHVRELAEEDAREVTMQVNKTEVELMEAVLDAMPVGSQPPARDFDTAVDQYPVAFDDLGSGTKVLSVLHDLAVSAFGLGFIRGDGTFRYVSRHQLSLAESQFTFDNNMHALVVPSAMDRVFRRVRVTNHPKAISADATDVLYALPAGTTIAIPPLETREIWTDYTDPNDRQTKIGGVDVDETLVGGTHYAAAETESGGGADLTSQITASIEPFASTAKWTIANAGPLTAYISNLSPIGKAVRDPGPQTFEASTGTANRPIDIDLPYQDNATTARSAARHVIRLYGLGLSRQIEAIEFMANYSEAFLEQALLREPGDMVTISEEVTGLASIDAVIMSVELRVTDDGAVLWCRWGLAPSSATRVWVMGVPGKSEMGVTTYVGF